MQITIAACNFTGASFGHLIPLRVASDDGADQIMKKNTH